MPDFFFRDDATIVNTYAYYDRPILFSCYEGERLLLVTLVDESIREANGRDNWDIWMYIDITPFRLEQVESGEIDLRKAFRGAENGFAFFQKSYYSDRPNELWWMPAKHLPNDYLAAEGASLKD